MRILLPIIFVAVSLIIADAEGQPHKIQRVFEQPQTLLPETSQHTFVAVNPAWRKVITFQQFVPGSFTRVENPSAAEKKSLYKEIRYFAGSTHDANDAVKILTYYPNGKRFSEIDKLPEEQFTQHFFSDGSFADFTHWQPGKLIAGVAIDPKTGNETHFSEGAGCLTTYDVVHDLSETDCYQNGRPFLTVRYRKSRRNEITLYVGNDSLIVSKEVEVLLLQAESEKWTRKVGEGPQLEIMGNQAMHGGFFSVTRRKWEALEEERKAKLEEDLKIWKPMYETRRPNFLKHYSEVLSTTDQSWESLHIEFIRDDAPWPEH